MLLELNRGDYVGLLEVGRSHLVDFVTCSASLSFRQSALSIGVGCGEAAK